MERSIAEEGFTLKFFADISTSRCLFILLDTYRDFRHVKIVNGVVETKQTKRGYLND